MFECVQAIENQKYQNFELVIVIDGANDQTVLHHSPYLQ
ncbi:hypothetical protein [Psychrobacillus psychrotolerans]